MNDLYEKIASWSPLEGWASQEKMRDMADLVLHEKPVLCVEVGIFGGRSALPVLEALRINGSGKLIAIDPYDNKAAGSGTQNEVDSWWWTQDLKKFRDQFLSAVRAAELEPYLEFWEEWSDTGLAKLADESVDFAHQDGNHSPEVSLADARVLWAKLKPGAAFWMDDCNWPSLRSALDFLDSAGAAIERDYGAFRLYRKPTGQKSHPADPPLPESKEDPES